MIKQTLIAASLALAAPAVAAEIDWYKCAAPKDGYGWQKRTIKQIDRSGSGIIKFDDDSCLIGAKGIEDWKEGDEILLPPHDFGGELINQSRGNVGLDASTGD